MQSRCADQFLNRWLIGRTLFQSRFHRDQAQAAGPNLVDRLFGANVIGDAVLRRALAIVGIFDM